MKTPLSLDQFLKESSDDMSLYEISYVDQKGKKFSKLVWAKNAQAANASLEEVVKDMKEIHTKALNYEEIEKLKEKIQSEYKKSREKIDALVKDYASVRKELKDKMVSLNTIRKPDEKLNIDEMLSKIDKVFTEISTTETPTSTPVAQPTATEPTTGSESTSTETREY